MQNVAKIAFVIALAMLLSVGCGKTEKAVENPPPVAPEGAAIGIKELPEEDGAPVVKEWPDVYAEELSRIITGDEPFIGNDESSEFPAVYTSFALEDMDGDGIPELILRKVDEESEYGNLYKFMGLYQYVDGAIKPVRQFGYVQSEVWDYSELHRYIDKDTNEVMYVVTEEKQFPDEMFNTAWHIEYRLNPEEYVKLFGYRTDYGELQGEETYTLYVGEEEQAQDAFIQFRNDWQEKHEKKDFTFQLISAASLAKAGLPVSDKLASEAKLQEDKIKVSFARELERIMHRENRSLGRDGQTSGPIPYTDFAIEDMNGDGFPELILWWRSVNNYWDKYTYPEKATEVFYDETCDVYRFDGEAIVLDEQFSCFGSGVYRPLNRYVDKETNEIVYTYSSTSDSVSQYFNYKPEPQQSVVMLVDTTEGTGGIRSLQYSYYIYGRKATEAEYHQFFTDWNEKYEKVDFTYFPITEEGISLGGLPTYKERIINSGETVFVDGNAVKFDNSPITLDGELYAELRPMMEALGFSVAYDGGAKTVTAQRGAEKLAIILGNPNEIPDDIVEYTNPELLEYEQRIVIEPRIITVDSRMMISPAFIAQLLNYGFDGDTSAQTASLSTENSVPKLFYARIEGVSDDNKLNISGIYYDAGRSATTNGPAFIPAKQAPTASLPISGSAEIRLLRFEEGGDIDGTPVSLSDFLRDVGSATYSTFEIKAEGGEAVYIRQIFQP